MDCIEIDVHPTCSCCKCNILRAVVANAVDMNDALAGLGRAVGTILGSLTEEQEGAAKVVFAKGWLRGKDFVRARAGERLAETETAPARPTAH